MRTRCSPRGFWWGGGGAGVGQTAGFARGQALARARNPKRGLRGRRKRLALQALNCAGAAGRHVGGLGTRPARFPPLFSFCVPMRKRVSTTSFSEREAGGRRPDLMALVLIAIASI